MGAQLSCPKDFQQGMLFFCRHTCPDRFKYVQEGGGSQPIQEYCASMYNNALRATLTSLPPPRPGPEPPEYAAERARLKTEFEALRAKAASSQPVYDAVQDARGQMSANMQAYSQIRSEYARYTEPFTTVKDLVDTLKPLRPPTAPASDLAVERKAILESSAPNFLLIQVELAIVALCLLVYSFVDLEYAPGLTVLLLSVGAALGIFLWK